MGYVKRNRGKFYTPNELDYMHHFKFPKDERTKEEKERDRRRMAKCVM